MDELIDRIDLSAYPLAPRSHKNGYDLMQLRLVVAVMIQLSFNDAVAIDFGVELVHTAGTIFELEIELMRIDEMRYLNWKFVLFGRFGHFHHRFSHHKNETVSNKPQFESKRTPTF